LVAGVALVLLATGGLKIHQLLTDPFADLKIGYSRFWLWGAGMAEVGVGVFVFWNRITSLSWWILTVLFLVLMLFASWNIWNGQSDCGCAGAISISPWVFWLFDIGVLACLIALRPSREVTPIIQVGSSSGSTWGALLGGFLVIFLFLAFQADAVPSSLASWLGRRPLANVRVDLGQRAGLNPFDQTVILSNPTDQDMRIVGVEKSCKCVVWHHSALPTLSSRGTAEITLTVLPTSKGPFHQRVKFYVDSPQQYSFAVDIVGLFGETQK
jgi:hypothetical protein